jgi:hypothetical protein
MASPLEIPYTLREISKHLQTPRSYNTLRRWIDEGVRPLGWKKGDPLVQLEVKMIGGQRHTTVEAYYRWIEATNRKA